MARLQGCQPMPLGCKSTARPTSFQPSFPSRKVSTPSATSSCSTFDLALLSTRLARMDLFTTRLISAWPISTANTGWSHDCLQSYQIGAAMFAGTYSGTAHHRSHLPEDDTRSASHNSTSKPSGNEAFPTVVRTTSRVRVRLGLRYEN